MSLVEQITEDVKTAMKNQDKEKLNVIRMVKSALQLAKINLKHELSDEEAIDVIDKQIKMRNDSIEEFKKAERTDLIEQYEKEINILKTYMPEQLSLSEVTEIINILIDHLNNSVRHITTKINRINRVTFPTELQMRNEGKTALDYMDQTFVKYWDYYVVQGQTDKMDNGENRSKEKFLEEYNEAVQKMG